MCLDFTPLSGKRWLTPNEGWPDLNEGWHWRSVELYSVFDGIFAAEGPYISAPYAHTGLTDEESASGEAIRRAAHTLLASDYTALPARNGVSLAHEAIGDHHNVIGWTERSLLLASQTENLVGFPGLRLEDVKPEYGRDRNRLADTFGHIYYAFDEAARLLGTTTIPVLSLDLFGAEWRGAALAKNRDLDVFVGDAKFFVSGNGHDTYEFTDWTSLSGGGALPDIVWSFDGDGLAGTLTFDYGGDPATMSLRNNFLGPSDQEIVGRFVVHEEEFVEEENGRLKRFHEKLDEDDATSLIVHGVYVVKRE